MIAQDVKDYFFRHFLGLIKVNSVPVALSPPRSFSTKRDIEVHSDQIGAQIRVTGSNFLSDCGISCSSRGFRLYGQLANVNEAKIKRYARGETALHVNEAEIKRYARGEIALHTFSKLKTQTRNGMKQAAILPQERANRLQWQLTRPKKEGEVILAWFGPIVEDAVAKLTLNKRRGTLLIWYNPQSRRFDAKGLYLYRRMGTKENLEWRWV